jgi:hypothetical protein
MNVVRPIYIKDGLLWKRAGSVLFLMLLLSLHSLAAQSQTFPGKKASVSITPLWLENATVDLAFKDADMETLLESIHEQTGITILKADAPVRKTFTIKFRGSLKEALNQIADNYDYNWTLSQKSNKTFLFRKRFQSPTEYPEWIEKEMLHVAEQICRALQSPDAVSEPYGNDMDLLHLLYHSLSPQQLQVIYQGGKLTVQDLDPGQMLLLNQEIYSVVIGGVGKTWQKMQARLAHLKDAKLVLRPSDGYKALTLIFPSSLDGTPDSLVVRYYHDDDIGPAAPQPLVSFVAQDLPISVSARHATNDKQQSPLQLQLDARMPRGRLGDLMRKIAEISRCKIRISDYLQDQTVSLWTNNCSLRSLMEMIAEQDELEWTYTPSAGLTILRRSTFVPASLSEVRAAFQIALPPDYRHFLGIDVAPDDWLKGSTDNMIQYYRGIAGGDIMAMRRTANRKSTSNNYDDPMMLQIWPTQPQRFPASEELDYKEWTPQTKEAVLWSLFANAMRAFFGTSRGLDVISGRLTPYEAHPELAVIQIIRSTNGQGGAFGYSSSAVDANGTPSSLGFYWTLKNASDPLSPSLQDILQRYK